MLSLPTSREYKLRCEGGGVTVVEGWDARQEQSNENFRISPEANPTATKERRDNINMRVYKDVAWLTFDQYGIDIEIC